MFSIRHFRCGSNRNWHGGIFALLLLFATTMVQASEQEDQVFDALSSATGSKWQLTGAGIGLGVAAEAAQSFTVGADGVLTGIEVQLFKIANATKKVTLEVRRTHQSLPAEKAGILLRKQIDPAQLSGNQPAFIHVDLHEYCQRVKSGEVLAIVLVSQEEVGGYGWQTADGNRYGGGQRYARSRQSPNWGLNAKDMAGHDLGFKTFIDPKARCGGRR